MATPTDEANFITSQPIPSFSPLRFSRFIGLQTVAMPIIYVSLWPLVICPLELSLSEDATDTRQKHSYSRLKDLAKAEVCRKLQGHRKARSQTCLPTRTEDVGQVRTITPALERPGSNTFDHSAKVHELDGNPVLFDVEGQK